MENKVILVGNPNVGKSVIFNSLTGSYVTVSNYPGTTVDISDGILSYADRKIQVIDTPGVNSLIPHSEDEEVTANIILDKEIQTIVNVVDAKNLNRSLLVTLQLIETGLPIILDLNMFDEAKQQGISVDTAKLSQLLQVTIVKTVAITKEGIPKLKDLIFKPVKSGFSIKYNPIIESAITEINKELLPLYTYNRALALRLLVNREDDDKICQLIGIDKCNKINQIRETYQKKISKSLEMVILEEQLLQVKKIVAQVVTVSKPLGKVVQQFLGKVTMLPVPGTIILAGVLFLMYKFIGEFAAGTVVNYFEKTVFGEHFNPWITKMITTYIPSILAQEFFIGKFGVITMAVTYAVAIIFPIVTAFFIFFGLLEDSGYLPRLSALSNRIFRKIGLNGRAILPMILGLGCGTMAVLTSRIMDTKKERVIITLLLALCIPCSAQLGVILGLLGGISMVGWMGLIGLVLIILVIVGYLANKLIPGERSSFIQEIPPFRIPKIENILIKTFARLKWYIKEAVPLFILGTVILFVLDKAGLLGIVRRIISPITVKLLGLPEQVADVFIMGFLRRDYGTAGLYVMSENGLLTKVQLLVSITVILLFLPCIAQFFVTVKERGIKIALLIAVFISIFAFSVGTIVNRVLTFLVVHNLIVL